MKHLIRFITILTLCTTAASAQESDAVSSSISGLQITGRTDEERCTFLLKVAKAYFNEGDFNSSIESYKRILAINPLHQEARFIIGHVHINAKQYNEAETHLTALINEFPNDSKLKNNLAWLYATAEDPKYRDGKKAVKIAHEAMVLSPNDHHIWSTLAEAYYVSGDYKKAYRSIMHMAALATRYGMDVTKESVETYNGQIRKCKRAWETQKMIEGIDDEE